MLDVGSGSGYLAAVFHHLVSSPEKSGRVVGIEHIPELVDWSVENLRKDGLAEALEKKEIELLVGDGRLGEYPMSHACEARAFGGTTSPRYHYTAY